MSNQALKSHEGATFTIIGQVTDITYHGVEIITQKGNGILGKMMAPLNINNGQVSEDSSATTKSSVISRLSFDEVNGGQASSYQLVRAQLIADNARINAAVKEFHNNLNSLKKGLLQGKEFNYADVSQLEDVKKAMIPFNVGKVVKIKLQIRMFSKTDVQGWNRVKTGGSSKVGTWYTMYIPYTEGMDLQQTVDQIADMFRAGTTGSDVKVKQQAIKASVILRDDDQVIISPNNVKTQVVFPGMDGKEETLNLEDIRSKPEQIKGSSIFTRKTATISTDPIVRD